MTNTFRREVLNEIDRLENRVRRLRAFLQEMEGDMPDGTLVPAPTVEEAEEEGEENGVETEAEGTVPATAFAMQGPQAKRASRPDERQLLDMLTEAPTNKNGSIDLRTDSGRTLRAYGYLDDNGFLTQEAEAFLHVNQRTMKHRRGTPSRGMKMIGRR